MTNDFVLIYEAIQPDSIGRKSDSDCGDCACATFVESVRLDIQTLVNQGAIYQIHPALIFVDLPDGYYSVANPASVSSIMVLDRNAYELLKRVAEPGTVNQKSVHHRTREVGKLINAGLLVRFPSSSLLPRFGAESTLISWLHVTNACPLACKYCYVRKSSEHMSLDTGKKAIETVFGEAVKHGFSKVKLKYAGGEPSLNLGLVETLHKLAVERARADGLDLDEVMLTSGVMTVAQRQRIVDMGVRVMVSLDALGQAHDIQRLLLNGRPTSHLAQETLRAFLESGVKVCVSATVLGQSAADLIELLDFLLTLDVPFSINYARDNAESVKRGAFQSQNIELVKTMKQVIGHLCENPPERSLVGDLMDRVNLCGPHRYTCAVGRNYLVIDHRGRISMCQQEMANPVTSIYESDPLSSVINNETGIKNPSVEEKESCRTCEWRYWCAGGCPALTTRATGRSDTKSPFCDVYKALFPEVVRLEGLRLLKHRSLLEIRQ